MKYARIYREQNGRCFYCGDEMLPHGASIGPSDPKLRTIDHVIPRFFGGKSEQENIVYACQECNIKKGWQLPEEYQHPVDQG